jgi:ATP diphosphatase
VRGTNQRFRSRFAHVERVVNEYYGGFDNATLAQMEQAWQEAKRLEKQGLLPHLS